MSASDRSRPCDVLISGAGPCGMALATFCARQGLDVLVCERGDRPAPRPRGETVYDDPVLDELLGPGFLRSISLSTTGRRRFYSPGAQQHFEISLKDGQVSHVFEWHHLMEALYAAAREAGARFRFGAEVTGYGSDGDDGAVAGVELASGERLPARTTVGCDGAQSQLGRQAGVDYGRLNCRVTKTLVDGFGERDPTFQYFFIAAGEVPGAPDFPPGVAFVFPRQLGSAEAGLYLPRTAGPIARWPSAEETLHVWQGLRASYPVLSDLLAGCEVTHEAAELLPVGGLHEPPMVRPGLALLGDAIGLLEATGASGLLTSMGAARLAAAQLTARRGAPWTASSQEAFNRALTSSPLFARVRKRYTLASIFHRAVFGHLRTAARINRAWPLVRLAYLLK